MDQNTPRILPYRGATPSVHPQAWVAPGVTLVGDVTVHEGASIWFGTVIRAEDGSVDIGRDANVQDGCVLHADTGRRLSVGENVSVGHRAVLHGCTIGAGSLVGMGSVVLNDAVVGPGSMVAAGAVVLEGTELEAGSLAAGVPARARRELSEAEVEQIRENGRIYAGLRDDYRALTDEAQE